MASGQGRPTRLPMRAMRPLHVRSRSNTSFLNLSLFLFHLISAFSRPLWSPSQLSLGRARIKAWATFSTGTCILLPKESEAPRLSAPPVRP
ncbi:hypothetical protein BGY98DRAFT_361288 [Russula aff. rugulosa BPL654]|nr:hypothetical protein BGY98DRAFT_361288 [Russula aff. rugulosa BPL654]